MIICKTRAEVAQMRAAGRIVGLTIEHLRKFVRPGVSLLELDRIAEDFIRSHGAIPNFKGLYDFPNSVCMSVNDEVVHGIPSRRKLKDGDIISLDVGASIKGWNGDAAVTLPVGTVKPEILKLLDVTQKSLMLGIAQMRQGKFVHDISNTINDFLEPYGYGIVSGYVGHGIGKALHEDPQVPNVRQSNRGPELRRGMCLAIEPMVNLGSAETRVKSDRWTVVTLDGQWSAHFEHSSAVTDGEPEILTVP